MLLACLKGAQDQIRAPQQKELATRFGAIPPARAGIAKYQIARFGDAVVFVVGVGRVPLRNEPDLGGEIAPPSRQTPAGTAHETSRENRCCAE